MATVKALGDFILKPNRSMVAYIEVPENSRTAHVDLFVVDEIGKTTLSVQMIHDLLKSRNIGLSRERTRETLGILKYDILAEKNIDITAPEGFGVIPYVAGTLESFVIKSQPEKDKFDFAKFKGLLKTLNA